MTGVRSLQRSLIPDAEDWEHYELPSLGFGFLRRPTSCLHAVVRGISRKAKYQPAYRFKDLSRYLDETHLRHAFKGMNKKAAPGVDKVTYKDYQKDFDGHGANLLERLKRQSYQAKRVKRKHIPKAPGKTRPLGLPVLEDKLLQTTASNLLSAIYEQDFYNFSYGNRPNRGSRQAADDLTFRMQYGRFGYVVEADIKGFFNG